MNILSLNTQDIGGLSYEICRSVNKHTKHNAVSVITGRPWTKKPYMHIKSSIGKKLRMRIKNAEVIHFNAYTQLQTKYGIGPRDCRNKKMIFHVHGTLYRNEYKRINRYLRKFKNLKIIVSTPNLLQQAPKGAVWFPSVIPIDILRRKYRTRRNNPPIVYFSPTQPREVSDWKILNGVVKELSREGHHCKIKYSGRVTHRVNMEQKSKADIYFDEIRIFYGINAIEAAAFKMVVIHGLTPYCRQFMKKQGVKWPFLKVPKGNREELKNRLRRVIDSKSQRDKLGQASYDYVRKIHSPRAAAKNFIALVDSMKG